MRILALETSTEAGSCALWQDGVMTARDCPQGQAHSETLIPLVKILLAEAGCDFAALDAIAFGMGPGAFTSLRVACGIAQGMAVAHDLPVLPVGSLEAMAWAAGSARVCALLDARMGEVYAAAFERRADGVAPCGDFCVSAPEDAPLPEGDDWRVVGNALTAYPQLAARCARWTLMPKIGPHALAVAELGAGAYARGERLDPALAMPRYVRNKVAKTTAERLAAGGRG